MSQSVHSVTERQLQIREPSIHPNLLSMSQPVHSDTERQPHIRVPSICPSLPSIPQSVHSDTERQLQIRQHTESLVNRITTMGAAMLGSENINLIAQRDLIAELQWWTDQHESDWALGLTDDPPPAYPESEAASLFLNQCQ